MIMKLDFNSLLRNLITSREKEESKHGISIVLSSQYWITENGNIYLGILHLIAIELRVCREAWVYKTILYSYPIML